MYSKLTKLACLLLASVVLASCAGKGGSGSGGSLSKSTADSYGVSEDDHFWGKDLAKMDHDDLLQRTTFYFDLDSSKIHPNYMRALQAHAAYLKDHPNAHIRLEGHTDDRGSSEYNIALGERRAQAVKQVLVKDGARASQISVVSYGKEKPAMRGHDESVWKYNRRVVIVYEKR
jgi:peptidoglycan-associated lipoprotein